MPAPLVKIVAVVQQTNGLAREAPLRCARFSRWLIRSNAAKRHTPLAAAHTRISAESFEKPSLDSRIVPGPPD